MGFTSTVSLITSNDALEGVLKETGAQSLNTCPGVARLVNHRNQFGTLPPAPVSLTPPQARNEV